MTPGSILEGTGMAGARSGKEKVAIVLLALGSELGPRILQKFEGDEIKRVMESASSLGSVDKDDLDILVDEFAAQFAKSLGLSTGIDQVRSLVEIGVFAERTGFDVRITRAPGARAGVGEIRLRG